MYRAAEPTDVVWSNMGIPFGEKLQTKVYTILGSLLILGVSFGIIIGLKRLDVTPLYPAIHKR